MTLTNITTDNFEKEVFQSEKKVLLDFWASWCGPCMMVSPIVDEIAEERSDVKVGKVNVDEEPALAEKFGITAIPTLVVIENGKTVNQSVGVLPKDEILNMI